MAADLPHPAGPATPRPETASRFAAWLADCFALDTRGLAVFRVALGLLVLVDLAIRSRDLTAFYTDAGIVPRAAVTDALGHCPHALGGGSAFAAVMFILQAGFALALLVGAWTRLATFATCFLLVSLHARNPNVLQGGDALLRVLLFWGIFLPLGSCWSIDARRRGEVEPRRALSAATVALVLQVCFLYWFSIAHKTSPDWRADGTAVYYALSYDLMAKPVGKALLAYPDLLWFLTHATFWLELVGPLLLFVPWLRWQVRLAVVAAFVGFHLVGLNLCLELGLFPYVCAAAWLALLPTAFWDRVASGAGELAPRPAGPLRAPAALDVLVAALLVYVFLWNVRSLDPARFDPLLPRQLNAVGQSFGIRQSWALFAPGPARDDGWFVCVATLEDGRQVDPLRGGAAVAWDKPALGSALFPNHRWRKFMMNISRAGRADLRANLLRYEWDRWNASHPAGLRVVDLRLYFILERTLPDYAPPQTERLLLAWRTRSDQGVTEAGDADDEP